MSLDRDNFDLELLKNASIVSGVKVFLVVDDWDDRAESSRRIIWQGDDVQYATLAAKDQPPLAFARAYKRLPDGMYDLLYAADGTEPAEGLRYQDNF